MLALCASAAKTYREFRRLYRGSVELIMGLRDRSYVRVS